MTTLTCDELRSMAAEVALGILSGSERADALGHMEHCVGCRVLVEGLAQTGDALLLLAPEAEPPLGFESKVASTVAEHEQAHVEPGPQLEMKTVSPGQRPPARSPARHRKPAHRPAPAKPSSHRARTLRRRRAVVVLAAAAVAVVVGTAATVVVDHTTGSGGHQTVDQTALRSGRFQTADGRPVGEVYAYNANPSWIFMNVDASGASGVVTCELHLANGTSMPVGQFEVHDGVGEWAHTVGLNVSQIRSAELIAPGGLTLATASLSS